MPKATETLTIQDVSRKFNITTHTLRFWEKELEGILVPHGTQGGQRRYSSDHLFIIAKIKRLKKEGLSLSNIKKKLEKGNINSSDNSYSQKIDLIAEEVAEIVRSAIYSLLNNENFE